jgi:hypothetical protein
LVLIANENYFALNRVCRQNLTDAMKRITQMEADYNDVIPRRDFEALDAKFKKIEAKYGNLKTEMKALKQEQRYPFVSF